MRNLASRPKFFLFVAAIGLAGGFLGGRPAMAQKIGEFENINFALQDTSPDCPSSTLCHFTFSIPSGTDLRQVGCWNALLSATATQTATLTLIPGAVSSEDIPLVPVKVTGNGFAVSQRVHVSSFAVVGVTIQSFGAGIVAGATCSITARVPNDEVYFSETAPFSTDDDAECTADHKVCTFEFGPVPDNHRWVLDQVACRNNLLSSSATEIVTLSTVTADGQHVAGFPLIPEKLTGNGFTVSQRIAIPAPPITKSGSGSRASAPASRHFPFARSARTT